MPSNLAIAWCELMIGHNLVGEEDIWQTLRTIGIEEAFKIIQETMKEMILEGAKGRHSECLEAMNTKEFRDYLTGKLGLM